MSTAWLTKDVQAFELNAFRRFYLAPLPACISFSHSFIIIIKSETRCSECGARNCSNSGGTRQMSILNARQLRRGLLYIFLLFFISCHAATSQSVPALRRRCAPANSSRLKPRRISCVRHSPLFLLLFAIFSRFRSLPRLSIAVSGAFDVQFSQEMMKIIKYK